MVYWFGFTTVGNRPNHSVQRFVFSINSDNQVIKPKLRAPLTLTSLSNSFFYLWSSTLLQNFFSEYFVDSKLYSGRKIFVNGIRALAYQ